MSFSENLKALMTERQITNYRLAKDLDVSATTVGYWLAGKNKPELSSAIRVAEYFGVTVESLMK